MQVRTLEPGPSNLQPVTLREIHEHLAVLIPDSRPVGTDACLVAIYVGASRDIAVTHEQEGISASTLRSNRSKPGVK